MLSQNILITFGREIITSEWTILQYNVNRLYYIHSGCVSFKSGNDYITLKKDHLYLLPQNIKFEPIYEQPNRIDHSYFDFYTIPDIYLSDILEINPKEYPLIAKSLEFCLEVIDNHVCAGPVDIYFKLAEVALNSLTAAISIYYTICQQYSTTISNVLEYIHSHFLEELSVSTLAGVAHLSTNYLIKIFKNELHTTPYQFIKNIRLLYALSMIRNGMTITEVSYMVGFSTVSAFSNAIKKAYGFYPSEIDKHNNFVMALTSSSKHEEPQM